MDCTQIAKEAKAEISSCLDSKTLDIVRVKYLGRRGILQELFAKIPTLAANERKGFGLAVNALRTELAEALAQKTEMLKGKSDVSALDISLPGKRPLLGRAHPLMQVQSEICTIFQNLGFKIFQGPEVETEYNNFEALNIPLDHPSRDSFDTFYLHSQNKDRNKNLLLRSHTSPSQIRVMKANDPPMAVLMPGKVYRPDAVDASHSFMFHQVEGIAVNCDIRFSDLKGVLIAFATEMFGAKTKMRFRPSFFPFTEPSAEVDISCIICAGKGCSVCKRSGWLEVLGCGMIHPHVFKSCGYPARKWRGFAFGMGVERLAMLKLGINDIRLFFENDLRFLEQF